MGFVRKKKVNTGRVVAADFGVYGIKLIEQNGCSFKRTVAHPKGTVATEITDNVDITHADYVVNIIHSRIVQNYFLILRRNIKFSGVGNFMCTVGALMFFSY